LKGEWETPLDAVAHSIIGNGFSFMGKRHLASGLKAFHFNII
jgi:hypothetical protein